MAVYYKLKSTKDYCSLPIDGPSISVGNLKLKIFQSKRYGKGRDLDLVVTNARTNEDYVDDTVMIQKCTSVLIRRVPWLPGKPIVVKEPNDVENNEEDISLPSGTSAVDSSARILPDEPDWGDFGEDVYAIHKEVPDQPSNQLLNRLDDEEDRKIKALVHTPALDWQSQTKEAYASEEGAGRVFDGRLSFRFGHGALSFKKPPLGYICHRCEVPGHFIQQCPTNGDPNFDIKRLKPATAIPKSMLLAASDGSYSLPNGINVVLKPNEAAFQKEIERIPSVCHPSYLPPELNCPFCKQVMKDAVLSSKCCFSSFCDKCIRDHIISKSMCICGAKNVLADDLLPNLTLRETINSILMSKSMTSSSDNAISSVKDMGSTHHIQTKPSSPALSVASVSEQSRFPIEASPHVNGVEDRKEKTNNAATKSVENNIEENADKLKAVSRSISTKKSTSEGNVSFSQGIKGKMIGGGQAKKDKRMACSASSDAKIQKMAFQDLTASYDAVMPFTPVTYNPYWAAGEVYLGFGGYAAPNFTAGMPYMSYAPGICDDAVGRIVQEGPCGVQFYPFISQRELAEDRERINRDASPTKSQHGLKSRRDDNEEGSSTAKKRKLSSMHNEFTERQTSSTTEQRSSHKRACTGGQQRSSTGSDSGSHDEEHLHFAGRRPWREVEGREEEGARHAWRSRKWGREHRRSALGADESIKQ